MTDILEDGIEHLEEFRHLQRTIPILYIRDAVTINLSGTVGRTPFEASDEFSVREKTETRDFLFRVSDLSSLVTPARPNKGDRIHEPRGATTYIYEVAAPGLHPSFRYSDVYRLTWRIHTKFIGTEATP